MRSKLRVFAGVVWCLSHGHLLFAAGLAKKLDTTALLVQVPVTVTDESGHAVSDLKLDDFVVRDQGATQSLSFFQACGRDLSPPSRRDALLPPPETPADDPTRRSTAAQAIESASHRVVVLFEPMRIEPRQRAIKSTEAFLSRNRDAGLLVAMVDGPRLVQDFSDDIGLLTQRLEQIRATIPGVADWNWLGPTARLLEHLTSIPGRKSMVRFIDFDAPTGRDFLVTQAIRANVALYLVDARGGMVLVPFGTASTEYGTAESTASGFEMIDGMSRQMATWSDQQSLLAATAKATGGESLANNNDLGLIYTRMEERGHGLYLLGYYLSQAMLDGKFHKVDVKVKRERLQLRTRAGYFAPLP